MSRLVMVLFLTMFSTALCAQTEWQLRRDEDGIKVFTASAPNSNFKMVRVECLVRARLSQLVAFLLDVDKQHDWIYNNKASRVIRKIGDNEIISWSEYNVPWPCENRDYVAHVKISQEAPAMITIDSKAEPDLVPVNEGKIRVKKSESHWDVTAQGGDLLKIVYTVQCDPAGALPAWLTNIFVAKAPYLTFQKLRKQVAQPPYRDAHVGFINE